MFPNHAKTTTSPRTHDELVSIEAVRRDVVTRWKKPFYQNLFYFHGAAVIETFTDKLFVTTALLYVAIRLRMNFGFFSDGKLPTIEALPGVASSGGFLSFFLSILLAQTYGRYFEQYLFTIKPMTSIFNLSLLLNAAFPSPHQREDALRITRYALAAYVIGYCYCSTTYKMENLFLPLNEEWDLLNDVELERINHIDANVGGAAFREVVGWALILVDKHLKDGKIDAMQASELRTTILDMRGVLSTLGDFADQPIPYFFYYFIGLMSCFYVPLYAINIGYSTTPTTSETDGGNGITEATAAVAVLVNTFFVCGLRVLFTKLSDPIGDDVEDLSILTTTKSVIEGAFAALSGPGLPSLPSPPPPATGSSNNNGDSAAFYSYEVALDFKRRQKLPKAFWQDGSESASASSETTTPDAHHQKVAKARRRETIGLKHPEDIV